MHVELFYALGQGEGTQGTTTLQNDLIKLLSAIESEKSLNKAAEKLNTSYRYFWGCLLKWEETFGQTLVNRERGKPATLTALGRKLLWAERSVQAKHAVTIAKLVSELNATFSAASDPNAKIVSIAGCYDSFLSSLQDAAFQSGVIADFHFNTGCEGLRELGARECMVAGFNFPENSGRESEAYRMFRPLIDPETMEGCHVCRRSQGLVVAKGNPLGIQTFDDIVEKSLRYAGRSPDTGTYTLQESLLKAMPCTCSQEKLAAVSTIYPSHMAVATAVASGQADAGLCIAQAAQAAGASFIPLVWENYYLAWYKEEAKAVAPLLEVLRHEGSNEARQEEGRDLSRCAEMIPDWRQELDWF